MPLKLKLPLDFRIESERLVLRRMCESDVDEIYANITASLDDFALFLPWATKTPYTFDMAHRYITDGLVGFHDGSSFRCIGCDKKTGRILTSVDIRYCTAAPSYELGYSTYSHALGKGYMTESVKALTQVAFDTLMAQRVYIEALTDNKASCRIAEKAGFALEGVQPNSNINVKGEPADTAIYGHTPATWKAFLNAC